MIFFLKIISKLSMKKLYLNSDILLFLIYDLFSVLKLYRNKIVTSNLKKVSLIKIKNGLDKQKKNFILIF